MQYALSPNCTYTESHKDGQHTYTFTGRCVVTGKTHSVTVPAEGLFRYHQGAHLQDAFPDVPAEDREFLKSGISPEGWKRTFSNPEGEQEEDE